jgi:hypothetical protein
MQFLAPLRRLVTGIGLRQCWQTNPSVVMWYCYGCRSRCALAANRLTLGMIAGVFASVEPLTPMTSAALAVWFALNNQFICVVCAWMPLLVSCDLLMCSRACCIHYKLQFVECVCVVQQIIGLDSFSSTCCFGIKTTAACFSA